MHCVFQVSTTVILLREVLHGLVEVTTPVIPSGNAATLPTKPLGARLGDVQWP